MSTTDELKFHRKSLLAEGAEATFQVPITFSKAFVGDYTAANGDIKKGRIIEGIASTEGKDQQGEIVIQDKMDCSYLLEKGYVNWNHSHAPEDQIGKPLEVVKLPGGPNTPNNLPCTFFRAMLFESMPRSEAVWNLAKALEETSGYGEDRFLGFSVEGGVRVRNGNILIETIVRHMAATHEPVNAQAVARCVLAKSQGFNVQESVLIDTLDNNAPHFIFKSYDQMMKSLYFASHDPYDISKTFALGDGASGASNLLFEQLSYNKKKRHPKQRHHADEQAEENTSMRKAIIEILYEPCNEGNNCKIGHSFRKGHQGALDHLVYCGGIDPIDAAEALADHILMLKSQRSN